jgi:hydrogenase nickel incorporation protein HypA/HybF
MTIAGRGGTAVHELSICGSIADIVTRHADGRRVDTIHLQVGQLRQIVPDTLVYCWSLVSAETALAGSRLAVDSVPAVLACQDCGLERTVGDSPMFGCPTCGGSHVDVRAGEEFLITSLDLAEA